MMPRGWICRKRAGRKMMNSNARQEAWDVAAVIAIGGAEARAHFALFKKNEGENENEPNGGNG